MKILTLISMFVFAPFAIAQIAQPNEQALDDDLNFKHSEDQEERKRKVASDKIDDEKDSDQERDVASDKDDQNSKIQYWKY